jgi:hypothetical protein
MADINLTQADADTLLAMEKHRVEDTPYEYPSLGGGVRIPLQSPDKRELFFLDITRPAPVSRRVWRSLGYSIASRAIQQR